MRILLTGTTGFIGSRLFPLLLQHGHHLICLVRDSERFLTALQEKGISRSNIEAVTCDLMNPDRESVLKAMQDCDACIHLAAIAHTYGNDYTAYWQMNYHSTKLLADCASEAGLERFCYVSTVKTLQPGMNAYSRSKLASEQYLQEQFAEQNPEQGMRLFILRPSAVYGQGMKGNLLSWIRKTANSAVPPLPPDTASLSMIHVEDVVQLICLSVEANSLKQSAYTLCDGEIYKVKEIERLIRAALGKPEQNWYIPRPVYRLVAWCGDILRRVAGINIGFNSNAYNTLFVDEPCLGDELGRELGYRPVNRFSETLPLLVRDIRD